MKRLIELFVCKKIKYMSYKRKKINKFSYPHRNAALIPCIGVEFGGVCIDEEIPLEGEFAIGRTRAIERLDQQLKGNKLNSAGK